MSWPFICFELPVEDATGRRVEQKLNISLNGIMQVGAKLIAGIYFAEVTQDGKSQRMKLVKQ